MNDADNNPEGDKKQQHAEYQAYCAIESFCGGNNHDTLTIHGICDDNMMHMAKSFDLLGLLIVREIRAEEQRINRL